MLATMITENMLNNMKDELRRCVDEPDEDEALKQLEQLLQKTERAKVTDIVLNRDLSGRFEMYSKGYRALHFAARDNKVDLLKKLLAHGADIHTRNEVSNTPLHVAVYHRQFNAVKALLELRADANLANELKARALYSNTFGETPVHYAVQFGTVSMLKLLIQYGGNLTQLTSKGKSVLELAQTRLTQAKAEDKALAEAIVNYLKEDRASRKLSEYSETISRWKERDKVLDSLYADLSTYDLGQHADYQTYYQCYRDFYSYILNPDNTAVDYEELEAEGLQQDEDRTEDLLKRADADIKNFKNELNVKLLQQLSVIKELLEKGPTPALKEKIAKLFSNTQAQQLLKPDNQPYLKQLLLANTAQRQRLTISIGLLQKKLFFFAEISQRAMECRTKLPQLIEEYRVVYQRHADQLAVIFQSMLEHSMPFPVETAHEFLRELKPIYIQLVEALFVAKGKVDEDWLARNLSWLNKTVTSVDNIFYSMEVIAELRQNYQSHLDSNEAVIDPIEQNIYKLVIKLCDKILAAETRFQTQPLLRSAGAAQLTHLADAGASALVNYHRHTLFGSSSEFNLTEIVTPSDENTLLTESTHSL